MDEPNEAGQQGRVERLGEGHVHGVVGCQVVAKSPDTVEGRLVAVSLQVQRSEILEGGWCRGRKVTRWRFPDDRAAARLEWPHGSL